MKKIKNDLVFYILFLTIVIFLFVKCKFGVASNDESFYLTIPYRLIQGDILFVDEWNMSQLSAILLYPFVKLYYLMFNNLNGILLSFRYLFIGIHSLIALYMFKVLKKYNNLGGKIASIVFLIYAPFNINALSYNSMAIQSLTLSLLILINIDETHKSLKIISSGFFFASAVLSCPYIIFVYIVYVLLYLLIKIFIKNTNDSIKSIFDFKKLALFTTGAGILAIVFLYIIFSKQDINTFFKFLHEVLTNPNYHFNGVIWMSKRYILNIAYSFSNYSFIIYCVMLVSIIVSIFDKKRNERHKYIYITIAGIGTILLMLLMMYLKQYINFIFFPINIFALQLFILNFKNINLQKYFISFWIVGMFYTYLINMASDQEYYAISSASVVSAIGSINIILEYFKNNIKNLNTYSAKFIYLILLGVFTSLLSFESYLRIKMVFDEKDIYKLTNKITYGVSKGLIVTKEKKVENDIIYKEKDYIINKYPFKNNQNILFLSHRPVLYLIYKDYRNAGYSAWISDTSLIGMKRLNKYYTMNRNKIPDIVYLDKTNESLLELIAYKYTFKIDTLDTQNIVIYDIKEKTPN